jgi:branched-chain amino acid transport system substrate-binding protein
MEYFKLKLLAAAAIVLTLVAGCTGPEDPAAERAHLASKNKGEIVLGAASPWGAKRNLLWPGLEMAVLEINKGGGVDGRKIVVVRGDDDSDVSEGLKVAYRCAEDSNMTAVIGHSNSYVSIPASIVYQYHGLLMMSPLSTSAKLTRQGFGLIFRNIPDDGAFGVELADFCAFKGFERVAIYHAGNEYGQGLANAFEQQCEEKDIGIVDRLAYDTFSGPGDFRRDLANWKELYKFDAIFLAGLVPQAAEFVREARALGIDAPILGGDGLDHPMFLEIAGEAAEGVFAASNFNLHDPHPAMQKFAADFRTAYGGPPDIAAAQGYEALKILALAMDRADSTVPDDVARALIEKGPWPGLSGDFQFDENGDPTGKPIFIKVVRNGRYEFIDYR